MSETAKGAEGVKMQVMRTQLGRVRGLGSAKSGTRHWWVQRVTGAALVPLGIWFVGVAMHLSRHPRAAVAHWLAHPLNAALMLALVIATFHHAQLGLQVVIEDYVHREAARFAWLLLVKALAAVLALAAVVSVLKLAVAG